MRLSKEAFDQIILVGSKMSNLCANFSQDGWSREVTDHGRKKEKVGA